MSAASRDAVVFDLDGVIVDSEPLQYESYAEVLAPLGVRITREEYGREWIGAGGGPEYAVRTHALSVSPAELRARKVEVYRRRLRDEARLMHGVPGVLERLGGCYPLGLATNSSEIDTSIVLDRFDLRRRFAAVVTRELYERAKPAPDAYLTAAARLGCSPRRCVVLEDSWRGVGAAHAAGCVCVAVPNELTTGQDFSLAVRLVQSLDEVTPALVEELLGHPTEGA